LTKPVTKTELIEAIRQAMEAGRLASRERAEVQDIRRRFQGLAPREREVMGPWSYPGA